MSENISKEIEALKAMPTSGIEAKYKELFAKEATATNRTYLIRQLAYRMQELAYGGISKAGQNRIQQLIDLYDPINKTATKTRPDNSGHKRDARLPIPGSFISKVYKGKRIEVKVLENGFEYESIIYKNLSAIAKAITGAHWNGFIFFGVKNRGGE